MEPRENIGIAIDGGGIRGMIVATGLKALEQKLGVARLADSKYVKVVAGTSTGSIIAALIAAGFSAKEMVDLYKRLGHDVFSEPGKIKPFGINVPILSRLKVSKQFFSQHIEKNEVLRYALFPASYSMEPFKKEIEAQIKSRIEKGDLPAVPLTLASLGEFLQQKGHELTVVITAVDVLSRRTIFLKSSLVEEAATETTEKGKAAKLELSKISLLTAITASSCIPTYWDPVRVKVPDLDDNMQDGYLVDGGVGSFGNPSTLAAWELCNNYRRERTEPYAPSDVTIYSFGTGYISDKTYRQHYPAPSKWWAKDWAGRAIDLFMHDANRQQSRTVLYQYPGIDLRRFQVGLDKIIGADDLGALKQLEALGETLGNNILQDRHALNPNRDLRYDPEHLWNSDVERLIDD